MLVFGRVIRNRLRTLTKGCLEAMADAHANASSSLIISDSSSSVYCDDNYLDLDQYLSYNVGKKIFSWNFTVEDLETFIDTRLN